jgi:plasmid stabilization system protein ParE
MPRQLILLDAALADVRHARNWYDAEEPGAGARFLAALDETLERIRLFPESYERVRKSYRRVKLDRFPYVVFYEFDERAVSVHAVLHGAQDPRRWRGRLP